MPALRILLDAEGAGDVDSIDRDGKTALHHCCEFGWRAGIETLLLHGASLDAQDNEGSTPLMLAIGANDVATVDLLLNVARNKDRLEMEEKERESGHVKTEEKKEQEIGMAAADKGDEADNRRNEENVDAKRQPPSHLLNLLSKHCNSFSLR